MTVGILLVGGFGTRLMPLTKQTPKPMLTVAGLPVTEHQLAMARNAGITTVVLATSYLSELFIPYFGDGAKWGMKLLYAVEKEPLGTGGAIANAAKLLASNESVVVFNGDVLSSHNLHEQIRQHEANSADVTLHLTAVEDARQPRRRVRQEPAVGCQRARPAGAPGFARLPDAGATAGRPRQAADARFAAHAARSADVVRPRPGAGGGAGRVFDAGAGL